MSIRVLLLLTILIIPPLFAKNSPIILLHGFAGWGRDEMKGFKYWGGNNDLQAKLRKMGLEVHTASVGPFSSNWDRACELYAIIKGGRVDYGKEHALKYGHARYGRRYPGLVPDWGKIDPVTNKRKQVHIIAHSQGGQTARILASLLAYGHPEHTHFNGNKHWIESITTLSTPHKGTTLVRIFENHYDFIKTVLLKGKRWLKKNFEYDIKLDQWGVTSNNQSKMFRQMHKNGFLKEEKDIAYYDLSPEGARQLNQNFPDSPKVYYFSYATLGTKKTLFSNHQRPRVSSHFLLWLAEFILGHLGTNRGWYPNDGIVNTISMNGPFVDSFSKALPPYKKGIWNFMGTYKLDHGQIVGILNHMSFDIDLFYKRIATRLIELKD